MTIAGVILAGGQARRMGGGDKCLLTLGGETLLSRVITKLRAQTPELVINANGDPTRFAQFGLPVIVDSIPDFAGPLAGVLAGMDWAHKNGFTRILTAAADTPFFPSGLRAGLTLAAESQQKPLAMAVTPDETRGFIRHPTFGIWDVALRDDLRAALQDGLRKVILWTKPHGCAEMAFDGFDYEPFFNVNTPQDLAQAEKMLTGINT